MNDTREVVCRTNERIRLYEVFLNEFKEGFRLIAENIIHISDRMDQRFGNLGHYNDGIAKLRKAIGGKK